MHSRRTPRGTAASRARHESQYDPLLFAATGSRSVRSDQGPKGASLRLALRRFGSTN